MRENQMMRQLKYPGALLVALFATFTAANAQTPAFPGALGFAANATGGRNGTIYHVTTLADSGPGSFRDAVSGGNRTVVFDVGGYINLASAVSCNANLTIAGQTAPGGIGFRGGKISFGSRNNIICRFIRIRPGSETASNEDVGLSVYNARDAIFDHLSIEFAPWNNIGGVSDDWQNKPVTNITMMNCLIANPTYQQFGAHIESLGGQWSWFYNIFANSHNRNPMSKINTVFINNVEYNCSAGYTTHTSGTFLHDIVNNYFIHGPASGGNFPWYQIDKNQKIYYTGNLNDSNKDGALNGSTTTPYWYQGVGTVLGSPWSSVTAATPTLSSEGAYRYTMSGAGTMMRDEVDALVISQVRTLGSGTVGTGAGTTGPDGGLYTSQTQTGLGNNGYGTITGVAAATDTDNDAMPDYWELALGSNPNSANPLTNTITGYTLLENYLNWMAGPHAATQTNTAVTVAMTNYTAGFSSPTFVVSNAVNGTITLTNGVLARFTPTPGFSGLGRFDFGVTEGSVSYKVTVDVLVSPQAPPSNGAVGFGAVIGLAIAPPVLPDSLTWRGDGGANLWNTTATNWSNGSNLMAFSANDSVLFDDTGTNNTFINLTTTVSPSIMNVNAAQDYILGGSGTLSGGMQLVKDGLGNLTLSNANTFSGGIDLNAGTLTLAGTNISSGSGTLTLNGGALSLVAPGGPAVYPNPLVVAVPTTVFTPGSGNNNQAFGGAITGSQPLSINTGSGGTFSARSGMTLSGYSGTLALTGSGFFRWQGGTGSSTTIFDLGNSNAVMFTRDGGTITLGSLTGGPGTFLRGAGSTAIATTYVIGGKNLSTTFAGTITNGVVGGVPVAAGITKLGSGTLMLTGNNLYTGTTAIGAGILVINGNNGPSPVVVSNATLLTGTGSIGGLVTVNSGGKFSPGPGAATISLSGGLTLNSGTLVFDLASDSTTGGGVNDFISMNGGTLTLSGTGTVLPMFLNGPLTNGTYTLISGGASTSGSAANLAWGGGTGSRQTITLDTATPGTLGLVVSGTPAAGLVWRGLIDSTWDTGTANWLNGAAQDQFFNLDAVTFDNSGSSVPTVTLSGTVSPSAFIVNSSSSYTFNGPGAYSGGGTLTKSGSGTMTVNSTNSGFIGNVNLSGGTLTLGNPFCLGSGLVNITGGATLNLAGSLIFPGNTINVPAGQTGTVNSSGGLGNGFSGLLTGASSSVLNITSGVSFSGTTSAQFDGFAGTIAIQPGGSLRYSPNSSGNTYGSLIPMLVVNGTLQPRNAGNSVVLGAFTGSGTLGGPQSNGGTGSTTYKIGANNSDANFSGVISSNTAVSGSVVIVNKYGTGTLALSGASTYTGGTTVNAGTLRVNNTTGSATGSGEVNVLPGATLAGAGIIAGAASIYDYATLAPGNSAGTLTFGSDLSVSDASVMQFELGTTSDRVVVNGALSLAGTINVAAISGFGAGTYTLFNYAPAYGIELGALALGTVPGGYNYALSTNALLGQVNLLVSPTAPPSLGAPVYSGGNLILSGTGGTPGANYYVLTSTNVALPMVNWTPLATNQFDGSGNFAFTNAVSPGTPQLFYRLQVP